MSMLFRLSQKGDLLKTELQETSSNYFKFDSSFSFKLPKNFTMDLSNVEWSHGWSKGQVWGRSPITESALQAFAEGAADLSVAFDQLGKALEVSLAPAIAQAFGKSIIKFPDFSCTFCGGESYSSTRVWAVCTNCNSDYVSDHWKINSEMINSVVGKAILAQWVFTHKPKRIIDRLIIYFTKKNWWKYVYLVNDIGDVRIAPKGQICNVASIFGGRYKVLLNEDGSCCG